MDKSSDQLNSLLRGEISAVETYRQARDKVSALGPQAELDQCLTSHQERVSKLTSRLIAMGCEPSRSSGIWGAFARLVEGGAAVFGEGAAIAALEEGEDHGRNDYRRALAGDDLDPEARMFIQSELLPEQERTHSIMSNLKRMMSGRPHAEQRPST